MKVWYKKLFIVFLMLIAASCGTVPTQPTDNNTSDIKILDNGIREIVVNTPMDSVILSAEEILQSRGENFAGIITLESEAKITTKFRVIDKSDLLSVAVTDSIVKRGWKKGGYTFAVHFLALEKMQTRVQVKASIYGTFSDVPLSEEQFYLWQRMESNGMLEESFLSDLPRVSAEKYKTTWP